MNKIIHLLAMLTILLPASLTAQSNNNYSIRNLSLQLNENLLHVHYDLIGKKTLEPVKVRLLFYDKQYRIYQPKAISPEANSFVKPGPNRSIAWDFAQDMKKIDVGLHPYLIAGDLATHNYRMGPEAALFSLAVPGLGNYFVTEFVPGRGGPSNYQTMDEKKTISSLGLIALGTIAMGIVIAMTQELTLDDEKPWKMN